MPKRQSNDPKRRIAPQHAFDRTFLDNLAEKASYTGSPHHKRIPADYGFSPPANPRPNKSLCDGNRRIRRIGMGEAKALFREGIRRGMVSSVLQGELPKHVWAVDSMGSAYEAKNEQGSRNYHGYVLGDDDDDMRRLVIEEWRVRCRDD